MEEGGGMTRVKEGDNIILKNILTKSSLNPFVGDGNNVHGTMIYKEHAHNLTRINKNPNIEDGDVDQR